MKILDNVNNTVRDDLRVEMKRGSKVSIAAACFSMYAYQELRTQLEKQISTLEAKMKKEKQLNRKMELKAEIKKLKQALDNA